MQAQRQDIRRTAGRTGRRPGIATLAALLGLAAGLAGGPALAQGGWPDHPVRVIVPFAPGGVTDSIARMSAEWLSARLGQPFPVENRSGANGAIAAEAVLRSPADGYTLFTASASQMVMLPAMARLSFDPVADFAPVSIVASNPMVLAVSASLGVRTLAEFVALARQRPGQINYSTAGIGASSHLAMGLFAERAHIELQSVPYRGGAPAMQALLTGEVAAHFGNPSDIIPQLNGGRIRVLAVAGESRLAAMPDVPTVAESGYPGFQAGTWNGIAAPAGTPEPVVRRLAAILGEACDDAGFRTALDRLGTTPVCSTPEGFRRTMQTEIPIWREAVRATGARLD
ncbi:tripartite tricarboxylate transporter substrate binding protein [Roseomonas sp. NAR14]|uniref:Tripartite tricarboxylate transporter substrate binding protein n=1 Tax=Roseomonas acroporae TaxID=2937791 RepID=A0A9X1Y5D2_9PROT|nr:tripartite tricarboxylate transporter substrate binding protein [Roseomonas acroporae]MCK8783801.1 tripartite tricarboxylate transporter substrate binding protein [Roseomonas acroporae]